MASPPRHMADAAAPPEEVALDVPVIEDIEADMKEKLKGIKKDVVEFKSMGEFRRKKLYNGQDDGLPVYTDDVKSLPLDRTIYFRDVLVDYCEKVLGPAIERRKKSIAKVERSLAALATAKKRAEAEIHDEAAKHWADEVKKQKKESA